MIPKSIASLSLFVATLVCIACAPADRWDALQPDYEERLRRADIRPIEIPEEVIPRMTAPPLVELPPPGEPMVISVEEAVLLSLGYNRDLRVEALNPVIAGTFEMIERGAFDPQFFAELEYYRERGLEVSRATGEQFSAEGSDAFATAGVRQTLPTGTQVEAGVSHERNLSDRTPDQQIARLGLSVTQSLLQGFGPAVNLVGVRQAALEQAASQYELRGYIESLVADTETAYWYYVLAAQEIAIFENALTVARKQRDELEQKIEVGILPRTEAAAARAEVALREQGLIEARSQLEVRRLRLLRLIGPGPVGGFDLQIRPTSRSAIDPEPIKDMADRLQLAEQSRPDLNQARLLLKQNQLEVLVTRNGLLPRLELFAAIGKTGYADSFSGSFKELDSDTYDVAAGIRFSRYIGNRAARARDLAARATRRQSVDAIANLQQIVRLDVRLAVNEVERARRQIAASTATRTLQEQTLTAEEERFDVGAGTSLLVAQAQRDLLAAQIAEVEATINYRIALVRLYLAEGSLLERRGIRLGAE